MMGKKVYRIASLLADHGLDNKDLAKLVGVSETTVSKWCKNNSQPSIENMYKICKALKVSAKELVMDLKWPDGPSDAENLLKSK